MMILFKAKAVCLCWAVFLLPAVVMAQNVPACQARAKEAYRFSGRVLGSEDPGNTWTPVKGAGWLNQVRTGVTWSNAYIIPADLQGVATSNADECYCRCEDYVGCVAFTWLGGNASTCWLHTYAFMFINSDVYLPPGGSQPVKVPADTVVGKVFRAANDTGFLRDCEGAITAIGYRFENPSSTGITKQALITENSAAEDCVKACNQDPLCIGFFGPATKLQGTIPCTLVSNATSFIDDGSTQFTAPLQACRAIFSVNTPPAPPSPPSPPASCTVDPRPGYRATGQVLANFVALPDAESPNTYPYNMSGVAFSNKNFSASAQKQVTASPAECNCICQELTTCVGYTWLGGTFKECWLHSSMNEYEGYGSRFTSVLATDSVIVTADTVVGRVIPSESSSSLGIWSSCPYPQYPLKALTNIITRVANSTDFDPAVQNQTTTVTDCMAKCWQQPRCISVLFTAANMESVGKCTLLSFVQKPFQAVKDNAPGVNSYLLQLQACAKPQVPGSIIGGSSRSDALVTPGAGTGAGVTTVVPGSGSKSNIGTIVGAVVGVAGAVIVGVAVFIFVMRKRRSHMEAGNHLGDAESGVKGMPFKTPANKQAGNAGAAAGGAVGNADDGVAVTVAPDAADDAAGMDIPGLVKGEVFTAATAFAYTWSDTQPSDAVTIESYVNDTATDQLLLKQSKREGSELVCPVIELSADEMRSQVQLVKTGLLGRGATALVFKCLWPQRFGNGMLACKVLKDGYELDANELQSFAYEADVLSSCIHPNVVRIYGYVLEPPVVCLILELLPFSAKDLLYNKLQPYSNSQSRNMLTSMIFKGSGPSSHFWRQIKQQNSESQGASGDAHAGKGGLAGTAVLAPTSTLSSTGSVKSPFETVSSSESSGALRRQNQVSGNSVSHGQTGESTPQITVIMEETSEDMTNDAASERARGAGAGSMRRAGNTKTSFAHTSTSGSTRTTSMSSTSGSSVSTGKSPGTGSALPSSDDMHDDLDWMSSVSKRSDVPATPHPMSMFEVLQLAKDIAAGLAFLHDRPMTSFVQAKVLQGAGVEARDSMAPAGMKIVHRDLKPANILISSSGVAKISDFGLARAHVNTTIQTEKLGAGTLPYMAPELLMGRAASQFRFSATNRVDIYSFAMILWELLARSPPWTGMTEVNIMAAVINKRRPTLPVTDGAASNPTAPSDRVNLHTVEAGLAAIPQLNAIIKKMWAQRELKRPTATEVHQEISQLLLTLHTGDEPAAVTADVDHAAAAAAAVVEDV